MTDRRTALRLAAALAGGALAGRLRAAPSPVLQVGPTRALTSIAAAARQAAPGSTIEVDAGTYRGDVAAWSQDDITIRAVGGRVRLLADGAAVEGKGIWAVRARNFACEGFDFEDAAVPAGNGSGIRLERGSATVRDCRFLRNDSGILTANRPEIELDVAACEFGYGNRIDGQNHHLYAGAIGRLGVRDSWFHHAEMGHLLKSRAALNHITHNRLADGQDGHASYELEFPNGGVAIVVGNLIRQSASSENPTMISCGAEGYTGPRNQLRLVGNTLIDDRRGAPGVFLRVFAGDTQVQLLDNRLVNAAGRDARIEGRIDESRGNVTLAKLP